MVFSDPRHLHVTPNKGHRRQHLACRKIISSSCYILYIHHKLGQLNSQLTLSQPQHWNYIIMAERRAKNSNFMSNAEIIIYHFDTLDIFLIFSGITWIIIMYNIKLCIIFRLQFVMFCCLVKFKFLLGSRLPNVLEEKTKSPYYFRDFAIKSINIRFFKQFFLIICYFHICSLNLLNIMILNSNNGNEFCKFHSHCFSKFVFYHIIDHFSNFMFYTRLYKLAELDLEQKCFN